MMLIRTRPRRRPLSGIIVALALALAAMLAGPAATAGALELGPIEVIPFEPLEPIFRIVPVPVIDTPAAILDPSLLIPVDPVLIGPRIPGIVVYDSRNIPGVPLKQLPVAGSASAAGIAHRVYSLTAQSGKTYIFRATKTSGDAVFGMRLFGPGSTSITTSTPLLTVDNAESSALAFTTPASRDTPERPTYYIVVDAVSGSGGYRLWGPDLNDSIPGQPLPDPDANVYNQTGAGNASGYAVDIYSLNLAGGRRYTFNVSRTGGTGFFTAGLWGPGSKDVYKDTPLATGSGSVDKYFHFTPPSSGTHYLAVRWTSGSGTYRIGQPASPFSIDVRGYSFSNFGGYADDQLFREVFGLGSGALSPEATSYYTVFKSKYGDGQCYGMAITAGMFYRNLWGPKPSTFKVGASYARDLKRSTTGTGTQELDEAIERHISKFFYYQFDPTVFSKSYVFTAAQAGTAASLMETRLLSGWSQPYAFGWWGTVSGGHEVNATGMRPTYSAGNARFAVYDNNDPNAYWWYDFINSVVSSPNYSNVGKCSLDPITAHEQSSIPAAWGKGAGKSISVSFASDTRLLHTDALGRRLGVAGGRGGELEEIPGGYRVVARTGNLDPRWKAPVEYYLPKDQDYVVTVARQGVGRYRYDLFNGDTLAEVDMEPTAPGVVSHLRTIRSGHGFGFSTEAEKSQPVTLRLYREPSPTRSRVYAFTGLRVSSSHAVTLTTHASGDSLQLQLGGPAQTYGLRLSAFNGVRTVSTQITSASISADTSQSIAVWDWSRLTTTPLFLITAKPGGGESIVAFQAKGMTPAEFLEQLADRRLVTNPRLADSIESRLRYGSTALRTYLAGLVNQRSLSPRAAGLLFAYTLANRTAVGRVAPIATLPIPVPKPVTQMPIVPLNVPK